MEAYWQWLCSSLFYDPGLAHRLVKMYGSPGEVYLRKEEELQKAFPGKEGCIASLCGSRASWSFEREQERLKRQDIRFVSFEHPEYPKKLRNLTDAPCGLFFRGELPEEKKTAAALVGARDCTAYGSNGARWFARELAGAGVQIISGMARGVDGAAHRGALEAGGASFGVLAGGVDICYPESNRDIYMELEQRGGILSEAPPGVRPLRHYFPLRNRILSGLSDMVLIIEARQKSGSLITADYGLEQGKEVYALPGPVGSALSEGCNRLIQQGAGIALSPEQLLEELHILPGIQGKKKKKNKISLERSENLVYSCLRLQAQNLETICGETGLAPGEVLRVLSGLQIKGHAKEVYKNYYTRT